LFGFRLLPVCERDACVVAAVEACDYDVGFSMLSGSYSAVYSWQDEVFAVSADLASVLFREPEFCCHRYSARNVYVALGNHGIFMERLLCQCEERVDAFFCYGADVVVH